MSIRINKVYTKTGDGGETSLVGGKRVPKDTLRIEAFGCLDELNSTLGLARMELERVQNSDSESKSSPRDELQFLEFELFWLQNKLFDLGAYLATPPQQFTEGMPTVSASDVERLEKGMDRWQPDLPELKSFVLPGGGELAARLHHSRTVARRAEILALKVHREEALSEEALKFINRVSDFLFVAARQASKIDGKDETLWEPQK